MFLEEEEAVTSLHELTLRCPSHLSQPQIPTPGIGLNYLHSPFQIYQCMTPTGMKPLLPLCQRITGLLEALMLSFRELTKTHTHPGTLIPSHTLSQHIHTHNLIYTHSYTHTLTYIQSHMFTYT